MIPDTLPEYNENADSVVSSYFKIIKGIIADLRSVIDQLDMNFDNARNLILELARRLDETKTCEQSQICREIKEILEDKIKDGKITEKWIEACLPPEYKRRYTKSEVSSLSKHAKTNTAEQQRKNKDKIVVDAQIAKSPLTSIDGHDDNSTEDTNSYDQDEIEQGPIKQVANQNTTFEGYNEYEARSSEVYELRQVVKRQTSILNADKISATEIEFTIPKTKYEEVAGAMKSSRDSISVTFDKSGVLQRADPDIFRGK
jgi:hypothetical protein